MNNFTLHTPTKILFGQGQIAQLREQLPSDARVMITYGGGSVIRSGLLEQIRSELAGMTLFEFGGIEPNPAYETLMGAVELARAERVDFLRSHVGAVLDAIDAGVPVKGYMYWSLLDNYEWAWGYHKRFGIVRVNYDTQERTVKDSGLELARMIRERTL